MTYHVYTKTLILRDHSNRKAETQPRKAVNYNIIGFLFCFFHSFTCNQLRFYVLIDATSGLVHRDHSPRILSPEQETGKLVTITFCRPHFQWLERHCSMRFTQTGEESLQGAQFHSSTERETTPLLNWKYLSD